MHHFHYLPIHWAPCYIISSFLGASIPKQPSFLFLSADSKRWVLQQSSCNLILSHIISSSHFIGHSSITVVSFIPTFFVPNQPKQTRLEEHELSLFLKSKRSLPSPSLHIRRGSMSNVNESNADLSEK